MPLICRTAPVFLRASPVFISNSNNNNNNWFPLCTRECKFLSILYFPLLYIPILSWSHTWCNLWDHFWGRRQRLQNILSNIFGLQWIPGPTIWFLGPMNFAVQPANVPGFPSALSSQISTEIQLCCLRQASEWRPCFRDPVQNVTKLSSASGRNLLTGWIQSRFTEWMCVALLS